MMISKNTLPVSTLTKAKHKGLILNILADDYPDPIDFTVLRAILEQRGCAVESKTLFGYIVYLTKAGYISYNGEKSNDTYHLTLELENKGMHLLDGFIQDATILFK